MPRQHKKEHTWLKPQVASSRPEERDDESYRHWKVVRIYWVMAARKSDAIKFAQEGVIEPEVEFAVIEPPKGWFSTLFKQIVG